MPGAHVADRAGEREGRVAHRRRSAASTAGEGASSSTFWWRRWIEQSRSPRWTPLPVAVEQDLDLDVAGALEEPLEDEAVVVERGLGLAAGGGERRSARRSGVADGAHALATAAGRRLDQQRVADPLGRLDERRVRLVGVVVAGRHRDAEARRELAAAALSPMARMASGGGPTQRIPASITRSAKSAFSARKPKPGWSASASRRRGRGDHGVGVEEVDGVRAVRGRDDRADPEPIAGPRDAGRDLASIGDEERPDRPCCGGAGARVGVSNAPIASNATRQRPPTRLAGSAPLAIQR